MKNRIKIKFIKTNNKSFLCYFSWKLTCNSLTSVSEKYCCSNQIPKQFTTFFLLITNWIRCFLSISATALQFFNKYLHDNQFENVSQFHLLLFHAEKKLFSVDILYTNFFHHHSQTILYFFFFWWWKKNKSCERKNKYSNVFNKICVVSMKLEKNIYKIF